VTLQPTSAPFSAPTITTEPVPKCPICGGAKRQFFASGFDFEIETCRNRWDFWQCDFCSAVWLDPRPAVSELATIYPPTYYAYQIEQKVSPLSLRGKEILDRVKFAGVLRTIGTEPRSFLDIGCGNGRYMDVFAKRGISKSSIYGLELSDSQIKELQLKGYKAFKRRVEDCEEIPPGSIDLATMFHVIEHVADPIAVIERIGTWLSDGGHLVIETPNIDSIDARIFQRSFWGGYHIPRHWTLFNETSLRRLFETAGLKVIGVSYETGHSFWMYSFHHLIKYKLRMPRLARCFNPLTGMPFLIAFTGLDIIRRTFGFRTSAMLLIAQKPLRASDSSG
jgi:2-polyprenyl-3-methyl-5-hydroxy-6-metoxy-1,4-benzoquinol methylase